MDRFAERPSSPSGASLRQEDAESLLRRKAFIAVLAPDPPITLYPLTSGKPRRYPHNRGRENDEPREHFRDVHGDLVLLTVKRRNFERFGELKVNVDMVPCVPGRVDARESLKFNVFHADSGCPSVEEPHGELTSPTRVLKPGSTFGRVRRKVLAEIKTLTDVTAPTPIAVQRATQSGLLMPFLCPPLESRCRLLAGLHSMRR
ncbi:hypothetical protein [Streptomyces spororaveus]|uniref:hypothetical protein n=1 Tax=Streptomyces spororaveus TaxID=284039 RepID=UPI00379934EA